MSNGKIDYKKLKLRAGLEIHQQLDTQHKLFCNCSAALEQRKTKMDVVRKQHPVASELGEVDAAAQYELFRDRSFGYQVFPEETCLVELDEEPPHDINPEALDVSLQIALLLNCEIPGEIHVMRKTITDGSNTGAFQRTMVVGRNGWLKYGSKKIEIAQVALEEDAAAIVKEEGGKVTYRLSRLGVPLVEISTGILQGYTPEQVQEIAYMIGIICRSTGKVKHGIGSIRQDVNVSIRNGARVEIKGVQELSLLSKVVKREVDRQMMLSKKGKRVEHETRAANPDGTTRFTRPLPGAARMYPETDVVPISPDKKQIKQIKDELPEPWTKKLVRFKKKLKLSNDLAIQIIGSDYLPLFENIMKKYPKLNATVVANVFTSTLKELRRKDIAVIKLEERHLTEIFAVLAKKKIVKEAVPELLVNFVQNPDESVNESIKRLNLTILKKPELKKIISQLVNDSPDLRKEKLFGIAMSRVRGRADPQEVLSLVKKLVKSKK
jgi:Glu-tRNA(Gln) amidotransferase subunit E-like FAD-binding protein